MTTNKSIEQESDLHQKGKALLKAAYEYWQQYRKDVGGPAAVVWLEADDGHFVLFTRSEYKDSIVRNATMACRGEEALFQPFTSKE